jgi:hypothetical protein
LEEKIRASRRRKRLTCQRLRKKKMKISIEPGIINKNKPSLL